MKIYNDIKFRVFRFDPAEDSLPRYDTFIVPFKKGMTVLDGLVYIQQKLDGSLAFRSSCRAAVCGSCAMHINGKYLLACETQVSALDKDIVTIRPMGHLKVLKDLVVDMGVFWKKYREIKPYLIPGSPHPVDKERLQIPDDRDRLNGLIDCILCGACYASCTVTETDKNYIGPAALTKVNRFIQDSRDNATEERLNFVDDEHGIWRCHTIFSCQEACPKKINPTGSIAALKRRSLMRRFRFAEKTSSQ